MWITTTGWATLVLMMAATIGVSPGWAQSTPPNAPAPAAARTGADLLPHQLHPNDWPQPDYFTEALRLTRFQPGERFKSLKLVSGLEPDLLVLPVQMQVFGWTQAFAALVGARLDREVAARGLNANRQTDLFGADGPYVRRFDETAIEAFASAHPQARVLALYVGRDTTGKAFVTMTLRTGSQLARVHRSLNEPSDPLTALAPIGTELAAMLSELGLALMPAGTPSAHRCVASDWQLEDLAPRVAAGVRACRAIVLGTLRPEFEFGSAHDPHPKTPAKLAWLAEAYVEADALVPATARAVRAIAWRQLQLSDADTAIEAVAAVVDVDDPVAQPLARLLWAPLRNVMMPASSRSASTRAYAQAAAAALPPFARAAFMEHAGQGEPFHRVDICVLERLVPALRMPAECAAQPPRSADRARLATRAESALLDEWRLAASYRDITIQGENRGDSKARQAVLDALPSRIAAHPFIRQKRFGTENFDAATGAFNDLVARALAAATDFVQSTADMQRSHTLLWRHAVGQGRWTGNAALTGEPTLALVARDELRMTEALEFDGYRRRGESQRSFEPGSWNFLRPDPQRVERSPSQAPSTEVVPSPRAAASVPLSAVGQAFAPIRLPPQDYFPAQRPAGLGPPLALLESGLRLRPDDIEARVAVALARMKAGQTLAQARALIDERAVDGRADSRIAESHTWAHVAHAMYFAGEIDAARHYYERVVRIGSGSESDLQARVRLRLIAGDFAGALVAARTRLERYEGDFARRDVAGLGFMLGDAEHAWAVLKPRLALSPEMELWVGASVGHRIQGLTAGQVRDWITQSDLGHARINNDLDIGIVHVNRLLVEDRLPSEGDLALLADVARGSKSAPSLLAFARLKRLIFAERVDDATLQSLPEMIARTGTDERMMLKPFYGWVALQAGIVAHPMVAGLRLATVEGDFDSVLAKAIVLGLENQPTQALEYLRAARIELANTTRDRLKALRSAPYAAALASWLLYEKTKNSGYRDEALLLARAYQRIFPFLSWPYALAAKLSPDGPERMVAACRAKFLDRGSLFLELSGLKPDLAGTACRKALW